MKHLKLFEVFVLSLYENYSSQQEKYIRQGNDEKVVAKYIEDFKEMRDKRFKEAMNAEINGLNVQPGESRFNIDNYKTFKEVELIVDFVAGQRNFGSANFEDIEVNGDPIYKDSDVEIYYADSPKACIQYKGDQPYGWCVARKSGNMFWNYRLKKHKPSFYFVKRIKPTKKEFTFWNLGKNIFSGEFRDKWHFFVLQVLHDPSYHTKGGEAKKYILTSAMNDGDEPTSWGEILKIAPELKGKESLFVSKPLAPEEREKIEKYRGGITDEEFIKLPFKEKKYYISIYVDPSRRLSDVQFSNLPDELKNDYLTLGVGLSQNQFDLIKGDPKMLKRYIEVTIKKFNEFKKNPKAVAWYFNFNELEIIFEKKIKPGFSGSELFKMIFPEGKTTLSDFLGGNIPSKLRDGEWVDFQFYSPSSPIMFKELRVIDILNLFLVMEYDESKEDKIFNDIQNRLKKITEKLPKINKS